MPSEFLNPITIRSFKGMMTLFDASNIGNQYLSNALNVSFADGSISSLKQYSEFADQKTTDDDVGRILSSFTSVRSDGIEIPLRIRDDDSNTHLEWYNSVGKVWEPLLPNLTTAKRMAFADFNTATQDYCYMCNGTENYSEWKKAIGSIKSNTATVITLNEASAATQGFASGGGTVIVEGTEYSYTGTSGATLTGLSGLPAFTANDGVAEAVDDSTHSAITEFDILWVADGRMWGAITTSSRIYFSAVGDATNWTAGSAPDNPGTRDFIEGEGSVTGLSSIEENIIVFKRDLVKLYKLEYPSSTTRVSIAKDLRRGDSVGAANPDGVVKVGETIFYITTKGGIKSVSLSKAQEKFDFENVTEIIRPTLEDGVFTASRMTYWEKKKRLLVAYKNDSGSTYNDKVVMVEITRDTELNEFKAVGILDWLVGAWFNYATDLYFGGSYEPNCFKAFDGWQKGRGDAPFTSLITTKRYSFSNNPFLRKEVEYIYIEGWILPGTKLNFQLEYEYLGTLAQLESSLEGTESDYIIQPDTNMMGAFELGSEPIGGTLEDIDDLNYFKIFLQPTRGHKPIDLQFTVYSDLVGARWKINTLSFLVKDAGMAVDPKLKKALK